MPKKTPVEPVGIIYRTESPRV
ncbi:hypothetical protein AHT91_21700 [Salmonella enterica]|nr:hypothetical protein [Salmonella enterica]EBB3001395.1 hypothetical protein [Salmonella enterica]